MEINDPLQLSYSTINSRGILNIYATQVRVERFFDNGKVTW